MHTTLKYILLLIIPISYIYANPYSDAEIHAIKYKNKINIALFKMGSNKKFILKHSEKIRSNENISTFILNDNIALTTTSDIESLKSVIFVAKTDGSTRSAIDLLFASVASIAAIINPYMNAASRHQILDKLGLGGDMPVINQNQLFKHNIKGYHIGSSFIKSIGYMITIDRDEKKRKTTPKKISAINTNCFINPVGYTETETTKQNVINYIKKHTKEQYQQINMDDPLTLRMMEEQNLQAFKRLVHAGDKSLLQKTIDQYCNIDMCDYVTIKMMYEEQFKARAKHLKW